MRFPLPHSIKVAALTLLAGAGMAGCPTGDDVADAASAKPTQTVRYPWKGTDDEIVVNLAIGSLRDSLMMWLKTERGVHAETLLVSIGAIAGFAAQKAAWVRVEKRDIPLPSGADKSISGPDLGRHLRDSGLMVVINPKSGGNFYFGDLINGYIVQQATTVNYSLFAIVAGAAIAAGAKPEELTDYKEIFRHVASTIGKPEFGALRVAADHRPAYSPREALDEFWPRATFIFSRTDGQGIEVSKGRSVPPEYWPLISALVAGQLLTMTKDTLDPRIGLALLMESAIAMSKVDPKTVPQDVPEEKKAP